MFNYAVCPCALCDQPLTFPQLREGVHWAPRQNFQSWWARYWNEGEDASGDLLFAHRRCWQNLSEKRRQLIRITCEDDFAPKTMGQLA
jgi:hypothetical protein